MAEESLITDELKSLMAVEYGPVVYEVDKWWLKKFAEAIDDPNPKWTHVAPPTFTTGFIIEDLMQALQTPKCPLPTNLNSGNELHYFQPICLGDTITVTGKIVDMREREGRVGKMLFMYYDETYTNQRGEVVAKCHSAVIRC